MKRLLIVVGSIALVAAVVAVVGALLPKDHVARRTVVIHQSEDAVWATITDFAASPGWRRDITAVELLPPESGRARFRETSRHGAVLYEVEERTASRRLVTRIADPDLPFGGRWIYELVSEGGGTRVTITEKGEVNNVIFRFLSRVVFGHTTTIDGYLRALGARYGEDLTPGAG